MTHKVTLKLHEHVSMTIWPIAFTGIKVILLCDEQNVQETSLETEVLWVMVILVATQKQL